MMMAGASSISPRKLTHSLKNEWDEEEEKKKNLFILYVYNNNRNCRWEGGGGVCTRSLRHDSTSFTSTLGQLGRQNLKKRKK